MSLNIEKGFDRRHRGNLAPPRALATTEWQCNAAALCLPWPLNSSAPRSPIFRTLYMNVFRFSAVYLLRGIMTDKLEFELLVSPPPGSGHRMHVPQGLCWLRSGGESPTEDC